MMDRRNQGQRFNSPRISEYEEKVIEIKRVSKKIKGGNAKVGHGYGKAKNVAEAIQKALTSAKKKMINIKLTGKTIAHDVDAKLGSAKVALRPASEGSGIIAGGSVRVVVELAGIKDISAKMFGSNNKLSNVRCTIKALEKLKK
jgi:small subunit ribosomal protein S5